jgi:DNA-binding beta-propeller fold protein YncE
MLRRTAFVATAGITLWAAGAGRASYSASAAPAWRTLLPISAVHAPRALAVDPRGAPTTSKWVYVADSSDQRIVKFGTSGRVLASWQYGPHRFGNAASLAIGPADSVYVANQADNAVSVFTPSGRLLHRWTGFHGLRGIAVDASGSIYLAENRIHRVTELTPSGGVVQQWDTHTLWNGHSAGSPTGLAFGSGGAIYVVTHCSVEQGRSTCARRVAYLSESLGANFSTVYLLLPLRATGNKGDSRGLVGLGQKSAGLPGVPRDTCNNRFVRLDAVTGAPNQTIYVAGLLWPRTAATPALGVGVGPGQPGCSHDGIGPSWTVYTLPTTATVHGLAVDPAGNIYLSQGQHVWKLSVGRG